MPSFLFMLGGKKILLGITGSIAAYKAASLVRLLVKAGADLRVIMTPAAVDFVTPLTLSTLSKHPVLSDLFDERSWANHVMLGRENDLMIIAPASCNTIARIANGMCENLLEAVYLSATCPVMIAPAMDEDMWHHSATKKNLALLAARGNNILPAPAGELASGLYGAGRMSEPEDIAQAIELFFAGQNDFAGKNVMVTAGPTQEPIDAVRYIGNRSTGKMGYAIAEELAARGAKVTLVSGPVSIVASNDIKVTQVQTAAEMFEAAEGLFDVSDILILCAAVADFKVKKPAEGKIKKENGVPTLELEPTIDILETLGKKSRGKKLLIGFALEAADENVNAKRKLERKNADMIVLNSLNDLGSGFGYDTNKITIFEKEGGETVFENASKKQQAKNIADLISRKINA